MTLDLTGAAWGCRVKDLHICRRDDSGEISFELALPEPMVIKAGLEATSMLPVMGRSGAGKSTLMNVLSTTAFPAPDAAQVEWRFPNGDSFHWSGNRRATIPLQYIRGRYFGYAFQQARLLGHLTVEENLILGRINNGDKPANARERVYDLMLPSFANHSATVDRVLSLYPAELSGGERQRVALLKAIARDPYVMFADEPTGSLDRDTRREVMSLLREWVSERPDERLLIWVTHHDRDPADTGVPRRLWVADGTARFEETSDGETWYPREAMHV